MKRLKLILVLLALTLVVGVIVSLSFKLPEQAKGAEHETDLAIFGLLSSKLSESSKTEICWLGTQGSDFTKRVFASSKSYAAFFELLMNVSVIDAKSSVGDIDKCLRDAHVLLIEYPLKKLESFPEKIRAEISTRANVLLLGAPDQRSGFEKTSIMFGYPDGTVFFLLEKR